MTQRMTLASLALTVLGGLFLQTPAVCVSLEEPALLYVAAQYQMVTGRTQAAKSLMQRAAAAEQKCKQSQLHPQASQQVAQSAQQQAQADRNRT